MSQSVAVAVAASALVLASLAACGGLQAAAPAEQRHCVALAVHVGMLGRDALAEQLRMALRPLARTGGTLTVWRATRSAASLDPIIRQQEVFAPIGEETGPLFRADRTLFHPDMFHPNERGYATWIPVLDAALREALGSPP